MPKFLGALGLLLVPLAVSASAQTPGSPTEPQRTEPRPGLIGTHSEAHRRLPNTVSDVSVGIEVRGRDVPTTSAMLAERSKALLDYLREQKAERLRTEQVAVEPETQQARGQPDRITGYAGHATVSFRTTPEQMPVLLAGSLDHGANALQQSGSSPREEEVEKSRLELAGEATRAALAQANAVAGALGQHVAGIERADVDRAVGIARPMRAMQAARAEPAAASIPAEAGETDVTVGIALTVRILP